MSQIEAALAVLKVLDERRQKYDAVNRELRKLDPDFPVTVRAIDREVETSVVRLLDGILGDEIASYYLWEASNMKGGGCCEVDGKVWPIRTVGDVKDYVYGNRSTSSTPPTPPPRQEE